MDEHDIKELQARWNKRKSMTLEERQVEALEDIADSLIGLITRLERIGDNVVG